MEIDRNGLEVLTRDESIHLLAKMPIGRVVTTLRSPGPLGRSRTRSASR